MANEWRQAMMNKLTMANGLRVMSVAFASCCSMRAMMFITISARD